MVRIRRMSIRVIMLLAAGGVCLVTIILNRYAYNNVKTQQKRRAALHQWVQNLREEGRQDPGRQPKLVTPDNHTTPATSQTKVILMHSFPDYYGLVSGLSLFSKCDHSCALTLDQELVEEVDCVIAFSSHHFWSRPPPPRTPNQVWVYFAVESPIYSNIKDFDNPAWHNRFNWTMTYRRDSDFYFGYGDVVKPSSPLPARNFTSVVEGKSKMVAWFVSNCGSQSKRMDFTKALKEFIEVDIYGRCGDLKCDRKDLKACRDMLSKDYYFYLSFENSLCKDYITEKAYLIMKEVDIVPVVRGGANYTALLPKNSFIDASQFPTVKALADYLKRVAADKELYQSFLSWKNEWQVIEPIPFSFCEYCQRLHYADRYAKVYPNVVSWWRDGICHDPPPVIKS
ncbi:alpha-(1,3)-fucosyltransferase C-like [Littorina saxatilis]|uniref:Fucosyltransferase n=1 Tax=Littorina saxatilis TaxID=31220 RepID=A0AAN9G8S4_9CAEN